LATTTRLLPFTKAYVSVLSAAGSAAIDGASRWLEAAATLERHRRPSAERALMTETRFIMMGILLCPCAHFTV
jgi:hypothetical protein